MGRTSTLSDAEALAAVESSDLTDDHREIIREHKLAVGRYLSTVVPDGEAVAVLLDGAIVQAAIFANAIPIDHARRAAAALDRGSV